MTIVGLKSVLESKKKENKVKGGLGGGVWGGDVNQEARLLVQMWVVQHGNREQVTWQMLWRVTWPEGCGRKGRRGDSEFEVPGLHLVQSTYGLDSGQFK